MASKGIGKLFQKGLQLEVDGKPTAFNSVQDFDVYLRRHAEVSPEEVSRIARLREDDIHEVLSRTNRTHQQLLGIHLMILEKKTETSECWREIDISRIPEDQHWQTLMFAMGDLDRVPEEFRRAALVGLLKYLKSRREVISEILKQKSSRGPRIREGGPKLKKRRRDGDTDESTDVAMTEGVDYIRLPTGEPEVLNFPVEEYVSVYLARLKIRLKAGEGPCLMDDMGNIIPLSRGKTMLGRSRGCDIVLDRSPNDVSRQHLVIEVTPDNRFILTDLSSRGTFVPENVF